MYMRTSKIYILYVIYAYGSIYVVQRVSEERRRRGMVARDVFGVLPVSSLVELRNTRLYVSIAASWQSPTPQCTGCTYTPTVHAERRRKTQEAEDESSALM